MQIINNKPEDFLVISGDDALTLPLIAIGGDGVISVVANALPKAFSEMVYHATRGRMRRAREIHYQLIDIIGELFAEGNPAGVKALMELQGLCGNNLRLPLTPVGRSTLNKMANLWENYAQVKAADRVVQ
jgi:4-hydroxy-tetrahydrodipicolinate synthase